MATVRVSLSDTAIRLLGATEMGKLVVTTSVKISNRAKILCPVDTGNLRASITMKITKSGQEIIGSVGTGVNYAPYVHDGTRPHKIRAKSGKSLVFFWPAVGAVTVVPAHPFGWTGHFAKGSRFMVGKGYVNHPGTKGRPFLRVPLIEEGTKAGFIVTRL